MKKIEITKEQLQQMIKEGVEKLHRQTLIENRIEQINKELNALSNPEAWEDSQKEAQNQLRKKTIAFNNVIPKERLTNEGLNEKKYSDAASDFIGKEISHLMHDKNYEHDRAVAAAINIAKDKGYKIPKPKNEASQLHIGTDVTDPSVKMHFFKVKHDKGSNNYKVADSSEENAKKVLAKYLNAPEGAIEFIKSEPSGIQEKSAPSAGLSADKKSDVVKKAKAGEDIGKKGKGFKDVVAKAKASGAEDPEAVAAAAMWKNIKRESIAETMKKASELLDEANKKLKQKGK